MDLHTLEDFFFWSMVINFGIYIATVLAVLSMRGFVYRLQQKLFGLEERQVAAAVMTYLGNYKLLITAFNFTPWLALLLINSAT